jgi:nitrous oxidase accessory protein
VTWRRGATAAAIVSGVAASAAFTLAKAGDRPAHVDRAAASVRSVVRSGEDEARGAWLRRALATVPAGAVIDVPPGRYAGPFIVERPVVLRGGDHAALAGGGTASVVEIRAADVTLEGFEISGSGTDLTRDDAGVHVTGRRATIRGNRIHDSLHGIYVRQADGVLIERNVITGLTQTIAEIDPGEAFAPGTGETCATPLGQDRRGNGVHVWNSAHVLVAANVIRDTRDGIYFSFVSGSEVRNNDIGRVRYGLHYMYSDDNRFEGNAFHDNAAGAALMFSNNLTLIRNRFVANRSQRAYGLLLQSVDGTLIGDNEIAGNTLGVFLENGHTNRILDNRIAANHIGIRVSGSSGANTFAGNRFADNVHAVETEGDDGANRWSLDGRGNVWQGASTIDLDGNGIADLPHRELDLFGGLRRRLPAIGLLAGSPAERLLRFVHARVAVPGAHGIVDPAPIVAGGPQ